MEEEDKGRGEKRRERGGEEVGKRCGRSEEYALSRWGGKQRL